MLGNIEGFTKRQVIGACKARELFHSLQRPGVEAFRNIIRLGQIRDCPVSLADVNNAELIFGKDLASIKGKTTRIRPPPVTDSIYAVPDELVEHNRHLNATMDNFSICRVTFLAFSDLELRNTCAEFLSDKKAKTFYNAIDKIFEFYGSHGFHISKILCDQEYKPLMDPVKNDLRLKLDHPPAQAHANPAERLIRTLEEGCRSAWHATPFVVMPIEMIRELVPAHLRSAVWPP